jgi:hypothetical protein
MDEMQAYMQYLSSIDLDIYRWTEGKLGALEEEKFTCLKGKHTYIQHSNNLRTDIEKTHVEKRCDYVLENIVIMK